MTQFTAPHTVGLTGEAGVWRMVTGVDRRRSGPRAILGLDPVYGEEMPIGTLLAEIMPGVHVEGWWGVRLHVVTPAKIVQLSAGWWNLTTEIEGLTRAIDVALASIDTNDSGFYVHDLPSAKALDVAAPRNANGRRRDYTSASQARRWLTCPGSVRLADEVARPEKASFYADEGTAAHELAEVCLRLEIDACEMVGSLLTTTDIQVTESMADYVQVYLDTIHADHVKYGGTLHFESSVIVPLEGVLLRGTLDARLWSPETKTLRVYDLKYGVGVVVGVFDNAQLMVYALGGVREIEATIPNSGIRNGTVEMVIVQPRREMAGTGDDGRVRRSAMPTSTLTTWCFQTLAPGVQAFTAPNAPLVPSVDGCRWCPAAYACPKFEQQSLDTAREVFEVVGPRDAEGTFTSIEEAVADAPPSKELVKAAVADLSPERIAMVLKLEATLKLWISLIGKHAHGMLAHGEAIPGFKLVKKLKNRSWVEGELETVGAILDATGLSSGECYAKPKLLSPAQMEKVLPRDERGIVATLTHRLEGAEQVVPEADKRPALMCDPSAVFGPPA